MKKVVILFVVVCLSLFNSVALRAQFKVQLISIKCIQPEENGYWSSDDETYIRINDGPKVWHYDQSHSGDIGSGDLTNNDVRTLNHLPSYKFNCPISVKIWEGDGGGSDDDLLGALKINVDKNNFYKLNSIQTKEFKNSSWWYKIRYKVSLDN